jgi:hypothetical protein
MVAPEVAVVVRPLFAIMGGCRQRNLGRGFPLRGATTEQGARGGQDAGRLGAHAQDATAAWGQDFEIELVEAHSEFVTGPAKSLFHRLAGEFAVCVAKGSHVSVVSLVG